MSADPSSAKPPPAWVKVLFGRNPRWTLIRLLVLVVTSFVVFRYILIPIRVTGISMWPSYKDGRFNFINLLSYRTSKPQRGDVVVVHVDGKIDRLLKRVIALPGETISIVDGLVFINGQALDEPYVKARMAWQIPAFRLEDDKYYVIGDNRDMGQRRHDFGVCREHEILGKVLF